MNVWKHLFHTFYSFLVVYHGGKFRPWYSFMAGSPYFVFLNPSHTFHLTVSLTLYFHLPLIAYLTFPLCFKFHLFFISRNSICFFRSAWILFTVSYSLLIWRYFETLILFLSSPHNSNVWCFLELILLFVLLILTHSPLFPMVMAVGGVYFYVYWIATCRNSLRDGLKCQFSR